MGVPEKLVSNDELQTREYPEVVYGSAALLSVCTLCYADESIPSKLY